MDEEDGSRLISPGMYKRKFVKKISRSNGRTRSDNKKRKSINLDKNNSLNSYFNHLQASNKGYNSFMKGIKSNDREINIRANSLIQRGVKTATTRPQVSQEQMLGDLYQASTSGNIRQDKNKTMNAISRHSQNNMANTYARRRIIIANDKPPLDRSKNKINDYISE